MEIITRAEAKAQGLKRYFTGEPCKNGHVEERDVRHNRCLACRRMAHAQSNGVPSSALQKVCCICSLPFQAKTRNQNICGQECRLKKKSLQATEWKKAHRDLVNARNRQAWQNPEQKAAMQARIDRYVSANPETCKKRWTENVRRRIQTGEHQALCIKRRERLGACTPEMNQQERAKLSQFYRVARLLTQRTGIPHEVDHIVPVAKGGAHHPSNLQILTATENRRKGAKLPEELAA